MFWRTRLKPAKERHEHADTDCRSRKSGGSGQPRDREQHLLPTQVIELAGDCRSDSRVISACRRISRVAQPGRHRIVVDLAHVVDIDSRLVATLVEGLRRARDIGAAFEVRAPLRVRQWLTSCQVDHLMLLVPSE